MSAFSASFLRRPSTNTSRRSKENGKAIKNKMRLYALVGQALIEAKQSAADPFSEIVSLATRRGPSKSQAATTGESIWPYAHESLRWHRKRQKAI
jgi:hypothetical protein